MTELEFVRAIASYFHYNSEGNLVTKLGGRFVTLFINHPYSLNAKSIEEGEPINEKFRLKPNKKLGIVGGSKVMESYSITIHFNQDFEKWKLETTNEKVGDGCNNGHHADGHILPKVLYQYRNGNVCFIYLPQCGRYGKEGRSYSFDNGTALTPAEIAYAKRFHSIHNNNTNYRNVGIANIVKVRIDGQEWVLDHTIPYAMELLQASLAMAISNTDNGC